MGEITGKRLRVWLWLLEVTGIKTSMDFLLSLLAPECGWRLKQGLFASYVCSAQPPTTLEAASSFISDIEALSIWHFFSMPTTSILGQEPHVVPGAPQGNSLKRIHFLWKEWADHLIFFLFLSTPFLKSC